MATLCRLTLRHRRLATGCLTAHRLPCLLPWGGRLAIHTTPQKPSKLRRCHSLVHTAAADSHPHPPPHHGAGSMPAAPPAEAKRRCAAAGWAWAAGLGLGAAAVAWALRRRAGSSNCVAPAQPTSSLDQLYAGLRSLVDAGRFVGMDIGGSLAKVVFFEPDASSEVVLRCRCEGSAVQCLRDRSAFRTRFTTPHLHSEGSRAHLDAAKRVSSFIRKSKTYGATGECIGAGEGRLLAVQCAIHHCFLALPQAFAMTSCPSGRRRWEAPFTLCGLKHSEWRARWT